VYSLVIDVGNTLVNWRLRDGGGVSTEGHAPIGDLTASLAKSPVLEIQPQQVAVSCLRPEHRSILEPILGSLFQQCSSPSIFWIENGSAPQLSVATQHPEKTGADRALAALAWGGKNLARPAVIIDAGTAVTVDAVSPEGELLGGWITPGWHSLHDSLRSAAPALPTATGTVEVDGGWATDSEPAIGAGVDTFFRSGVMGLHRRVFEGLKIEFESDPETVITGGDAHRLEGLIAGARSIPNLVLDGLEAVLSREKQR